LTLRSLLSVKPKNGPRFAARIADLTNFGTPMTDDERRALEEEQLECERTMWRWPISMDEYDKAFERSREIDRLLGLSDQLEMNMRDDDEGL